MSIVKFNFKLYKLNFKRKTYYKTNLDIIWILAPMSSSSTVNSSESSTRRKRSWSRAVFSSLQRKGLERRFSLQKYITKPDRRQLAATLGLTDAQVLGFIGSFKHTV